MSLEDPRRLFGKVVNVTAKGSVAGTYKGRAEGM
jgi:hypothetical protein